MIEILFTLVAIFVAYMAYGSVDALNVQLKPVEPVVPDKILVKPLVAEQVKPAPPVLKAIMPEQKPTTSSKKAAIKPAIVPSVTKASIRNPKTGEIASVAGNYRFIKRWVKEALVVEGLLPKIYKNNELDAATEALIKTALTQLEAREQYHL